MMNQSIPQNFLFLLQEGISRYHIQKFQGFCAFHYVFESFESPFLLKGKRRCYARMRSLNLKGEVEIMENIFHCENLL